MSPGRLVFTEELEKFSGCDYPHILKEITGNKAPDGFNIGGTSLVSLIHDNLASILRKAKTRNCINVVNTVFDFRSEKKNPGVPWPLGERRDRVHHGFCLRI